MRYNYVCNTVTHFLFAERRIVKQNEKCKETSVSRQRTYTVEDIAIILNISRSSAYRLIKERYFKSVKIGNAIRISKKSFDDWLDSRSA